MADIEPAHPGVVEAGPLITVIVVNWNGAELLPDCLDTLAKQDLDRGLWRAVVVDNGSTDGSLALMAERYDWVEVIRNADNLGFAGGNNVAIAASSTPFVALLNNDAYPSEDWLRVLLAATQAPDADEIAAWTSKVLFERPGPPTINNAGSILLRDGSGADRGYDTPDDGNYDTVEDVFLMSGTAVLIRCDALDQVGTFNPAFFMYYEDTDLSWRLQAAGWRIRYQPDAVVRHLHSASSVEWSPFFTRHVERNRLAMLTRNAPLRFAATRVLRYQLTTATQIRRALLDAVRHRRRPAVRPTLLRLRITGEYLAMLPGLLGRRVRDRRLRAVQPAELLSRWATDRD